VIVYVWSSVEAFAQGCGTNKLVLLGIELPWLSLSSSVMMSRDDLDDSGLLEQPFRKVLREKGVVADGSTEGVSESFAVQNRVNSP